MLYTELATINLAAIHSEKAAINTKYRKLVDNCKKNPNYYNLAKNQMVSLLEQITTLEKEAKVCRRYIRKARSC